MLNKVLIVYILLFLINCGGIEYTYDNTEVQKNILQNKVVFEFSGKELPSLYRYSSSYFGKTNEPKYKVIVNIDEKKTKRSVQTNQAVSKVDYELKFLYKLTNILENCLLIEREIYSRFSYTPKSSGYNFGSDKSLENLYNLSIEDNFNKFNNVISSKNKLMCSNEN